MGKEMLTVHDMRNQPICPILGIINVKKVLKSEDFEVEKRKS